MSNKLQLVIGNKNYSSWSMRPWLLLHFADVLFEEINESLNQDNLANRLGKYSESQKVPVLFDDDITIWDSLAICEYISETYMNGTGWPSDTKMRAQARAVCAEMHSGFVALRTEMPMNCRLQKEIKLSEQALKDVKRIESIWQQFVSEDDAGNLSLFGGFGIADCFFIPVALRFKTYGIKLSGKAQLYSETILNHPSVLAWLELAALETEVLLQNEV